MNKRNNRNGWFQFSMMVLICTMVMSLCAFTAYAETNNATTSGISSTVNAPPGSPLSANMLVAIFVPVLVAGFKKLLPNIPTKWLPVVAIGLGALSDTLIQMAGFSGSSAMTGALLGAAGIGLREVYDQHKELWKGNEGFVRGCFAVILAIALVPLAVGCKSTPKLAAGGPYAPLQTNAVTGEVSAAAAPDTGFFMVEAAYDLAYSTIDAAFQFERDNRQYLWSVSPEIKHTLDKIRPQAVEVRLAYAKARQAYLANPTPAGLNQLNLVLGRLRQISAAATAAMPASSGH